MKLNQELWIQNIQAENKTNNFLLCVVLTNSQKQHRHKQLLITPTNAQATCRCYQSSTSTGAEKALNYVLGDTENQVCVPEEYRSSLETLLRRAVSSSSRRHLPQVACTQSPLCLQEKPVWRCWDFVECFQTSPLTWVFSPVFTPVTSTPAQALHVGLLGS